MGNNRYRLNRVMTLREEDCAAFDSEKFRIYKFNKKGFRLISALGEEGVTMSELKSVSEAENISEENFNRFVRKCEQNGIIVPIL